MISFIGWMFAWLLSCLLFLTVGFAAGWWVAQAAAPASTAANAAHKGLSLVSGWLTKKQKAAEGAKE